MMWRPATRNQAEGRLRSKGGLVTVGTVAGLLVATCATLFGIGAATTTFANELGISWLYSSGKGEVARVNGATGKVDTRVTVRGTQGHAVQVSQNNRYLILRDINTGKVSVIDLANPQQVATTMPTTAGIGVTIALQGNTAFVIDTVQGVVTQLDPATLKAVGQPLTFPRGIAGGAFDGEEHLWVLVPSEGTVVAIKPAPPASPSPDGAAPGQGGSPTIARSVPVADPAHDLTFSALDRGVAVLDKTATVLTTLRGEESRATPLPLTGPGAMPARTTGADVPVTVVDDKHVYVVTGETVTDFEVPGASPELQPCVAFAGRLYCADEATGTVYVLDKSGRHVETIRMERFGGKLELEVRENHLFINDPAGSTAKVVDDKGKIKTVDKYRPDVPGGDPPPEPPKPKPKKPVVGPPGAPTSVTASAGDAEARVSWTPAPTNGAAITRYVVEGDGKAPRVVGADKRSIVIDGLTNGQQYRFTVHAVNAKGAGPKRSSNPVVPTSDVPDPPASVTATANPNGTVTVDWPAANGQGRRIVRYEVVVRSPGGQETIRDDATPGLEIAAGRLTYGTQYAFTVISINERNASSEESPVSNTVVPFTAPDAPRNVQAVTVDAKGAIQVTWQPADDNGRPISRYEVSWTGAATGRQDVTGTSADLVGLPDGATVTATVRAVNDAGPGPGASATARTIAPPTITLSNSNPAPGYRQITVNFTVNGNGGSTTCTISVNGGPASGIGCTGGAVGGLSPGTSYNYTVTVTNRAGSATASGSQTTATVRATVICPDNSDGYCNNGIWAYRTATQSGTAVNPSLPTGTVFDATCKVNGGNVNAQPWGGRNSAVWLRTNRGGTAYFPYAWASLNGGATLNDLPNC